MTTSNLGLEILDGKIRDALGLPEDAPHDFDHYLREIRQLRSDVTEWRDEASTTMRRALLAEHRLKHNADRTCMVATCDADKINDLNTFHEGLVILAKHHPSQVAEKFKVTP